MRYLLLAIIAAGMLALPALAEPPKDGGKKGDRPGREEMRAKMLKEFDKDGDGKLSDDEKQKAHEAMRERFGRGDRKGRPEGAKGKTERRGHEEKHGRPGEHGPEAARGPHGPMGGPPLPSPEELFKKFDADSNDSLSRDEFMKLAEFVREHHPHPPGPPPGGRRFEGRGPDGPRGEFRPRGPRPDGPPRGDGPRDRDARRPDRERPRDDGSKDKPEGNPEEST